MVASAGCAIQRPAQHAPTRYRLLGVHASVPAPGRAPVVVRLLPVDAPQGFDTAAMVYSPAPQRIMHYRDNSWVAPPADLVREALAQTLRRQTWIAAVETDAVPAAPDWTLHCGLERLEHDLRGASGEVRLAMDCQLVRGVDGDLVAHWRTDASMHLSTNDAAHYAEAAQTLLDAALRTGMERMAVATSPASPAGTASAPQKPLGASASASAGAR